MWGLVFAVFLTMPYGKFVHGIYRCAALVLYAKERAALADAEARATPANTTGQGGTRP